VAERNRIASRFLGCVLLGAVVLLQACKPKQPATLTGVVLLADPDVKKQVPIADAEIVARLPTATVSGKSDARGLFHLILPPGSQPAGIAVSVRHGGYQPVEVNVSTPAELILLRLPSSAPPTTARERQQQTVIGNVRIRYSAKSDRINNIGVMAQTFEVNSTGNVACNGAEPCSPDGRWKASIGGYSADAGPGNEYRNVRLSCIAGPCPFTHIESETSSQNGRLLKVSVRDWSDTATFLLEAEVSQTRMADVIRQSYPAIFGSTMSFTLPQDSEGPSIEAELDGHDIVFPLGPDLIVSWANCTVTPSSGQGSLYRCELKPEYRFRPPT